jgi:dolichol-phosphate mannosyltransferase
VNNALVIIPTYNEAASVVGMIERVMRSGNDVDLLIVDDASPDGTGLIADRLAESNSRLHVLHRTGKLGLGSAYREGFRWGLDQGYGQLVEMDGDGSHQPEQLHRLLAGLDHADLVLGSRWVEGGVVTDWPLKRILLSRAGGTYARIALGLPFSDITGGYRAFSADALRRIDPSIVASEGYCFQIDMLWRAHLAGLTITEVPITFTDRRYGDSKMSGRIVIEAILRVTAWGLRGLPSRIAVALHPRIPVLTSKEYAARR